MTTAELADRWVCSRGWIANQRSMGLGPDYVKINSKVLYPIAAVERYEQANLVSAA